MVELRVGPGRAGTQISAAVVNYGNIGYGLKHQSEPWRVTDTCFSRDTLVDVPADPKADQLWMLPTRSSNSVAQRLHIQQGTDHNEFVRIT